MLFEYNDEELTPLKLNEKDSKEVQPCDKKAFNWCYRICTLSFVSVLLLSVSLVAGQQYSNALYSDDAEQPKILAMGNTCKNITWNCNIIDADEENVIVYEISYFEDSNYDLLYLDTICDARVDFPMIYVENKRCCKFILYNTI